MRIFFAGILVFSMIYAEEVSILHEKCDSKNSESYFKIGLKYEKTKNFNKAVGYFNEACSGNFPKACNRLAGLHMKMATKKEDYSKSVSLYKFACDNKYYISCINLGSLYLYGEGVEQNKEKARNIFSKACRNKDKLACMSLDNINKGVVFNQSYIKMQCDYDNASACRYLGYLYANGLNVKKDLDLATIYYDKACKIGHKFACIELKEMAR